MQDQQKAPLIALISKLDASWKKFSLEDAGYRVHHFQTPEVFFKFMDFDPTEKPTAVVTAAFFKHPLFFRKGTPIDCDDGDHVPHMLDEFPEIKVVAYTHTSSFPSDPPMCRLPTKGRFTVKEKMGNFERDIIPSLNKLLAGTSNPAPQENTAFPKETKPSQGEKMQAQQRMPYIALISRQNIEEKIALLKEEEGHVHLFQTPEDFFNFMDSNPETSPDCIVTSAFFKTSLFFRNTNLVACEEGDHVERMLHEFPRAKVVAYSHSEPFYEGPHAAAYLAEKWNGRLKIRSRISNFQEDVLPAVREFLAPTNKTSPQRNVPTPAETRPSQGKTMQTQQTIDPIVLISRQNFRGKREFLEENGYDVRHFRTPGEFFEEINYSRKALPTLIVTAARFIDADFRYRRQVIDCEDGEHIPLMLQEFPRTHVVAYTLENSYNLFRLPPQMKNRFTVKNNMRDFGAEIVPAVREILDGQSKPITLGNSPTRVIFLVDKAHSPETVAKRTNGLAGLGHDVHVVRNNRELVTVWYALDGKVDALIVPEKEKIPPIQKNGTPILSAPFKGDFNNDVASRLQRHICKNRGVLKYRNKGAVLTLGS